MLSHNSNQTDDFPCRTTWHCAVAIVSTNSLQTSTADIGLPQGSPYCQILGCRHSSNSPTMIRSYTSWKAYPVRGCCSRALRYQRPIYELFALSIVNPTSQSFGLYWLPWLSSESPHFREFSAISVLTATNQIEIGNHSLDSDISSLSGVEVFTVSNRSGFRFKNLYMLCFIHNFIHECEPRFHS